MATAVASGRWPCACDRQRRLEAAHPTLKQERPWHWEEMNGCQRPAAAAVAYWDTKPMYRCPALLVDPEWWPYLSLYRLWREGRPLVAATVAKEPAVLVDIMQTISEEIAKLQAEEMERQQASSQKPGEKRRAISPVRPSTGPKAPKRRSRRR